MHCGAPLEAVCRRCGAELPTGARFCPQCAHPAEASAAQEPEEASPEPRSYTPKHLAERILTNRSVLEGERKHVTVLFADLRDSTPLAERVGAEEMHALMDRAFGLMLEEVHRYEGTVNQFLGDGILALFGAPIALEDAPRRAVLAALGIQRHLSMLDEEVQARHGVEFKMRIGIHTGPVVVGRIGDDLRMDYSAVGDTTNLAARLQARANPGEVLISDAARRLVAGFFELEDQGEQAIKGRSKPVRAYRVVAERAVSGRIDAVTASGLTPLVGRQQELSALRAAFEAARAGRGQACFLVGEAGLGKSRLLHEFRRELRDEPHTWFEGRCASYGSTTAFQSIIDGLQRSFGIDDRDDDDGALAKLERAVRGASEDLAWTLPFLQKLLSLPVADPAVEELDAITRRSETIRALHALLLRGTERQPLVFVIEDLHWIDAATQEFLEFLIDSIPATRACLLLTHRPGYQHPFGDRSYHVRVALQSLSAAEMAAMVGSVLETSDLPAELRDLIAKKAEGNPFFVEEVTRSLLEEGVLRVGEGRVELARSLSEITVPDSIQDVLMARIDRLDEEPKRAIQMASVIGREFALRLLERIVEAGEAMGAVVSELRALELIYQKAAHPELAFMFKHALTHDVAYESVLARRRKALHRIVGSAIQELYADRLAEHYEALAHHFAQAEEWDRALLFHERAAQKARDVYANHSAADHYREALAIAERLGDSVSKEHRRGLAEGLGDVCLAVSEFRQGGDAYVHAAESSEEPTRRATNLARAGNAYIWGHHYELGREVSDEARSLARACGAEPAEAIVRATRTMLLMASEGLAGFERPSEAGAAASRVATRSGDDEAIAIALCQEAICSEMRGEYRSAIALAERALASASQIQASWKVIMARWVVGLSFTCLGEYRPALAAIRDALDLSSRIGDRALRSRLLNTLGWYFAECGAHDRASEANAQSAELAREMVELGLVAAAPEIHCNAVINLACNRIALGDVDGGRELIEPIRADLNAPGDPWQRWRYGMHVSDALARAELSSGRPEQALALVDEELAAARRHLARKIEARALELRGRALVVLDRREEATRSLEAALEVARGLGYPPATWRSLSLLAELARRAGDRAQADRLSSEACGLAERLAGTLPETELRHELGALGDRLVTDPLGAYR
jgi:predicted ATPase/class 3 adenylate cyclase